MTRELDPGTLAALQAPHVTLLLLLELGWDSGTQYLTTAPHDVDWGGHTYIAAGGIGSVEPITETSAEARGLVFTLSAVTESALAASFDDVQGRPVTLRLGLVDSAGVLRVDPNVWTGRFDVIGIDDSGSSPVIRVTAEHPMAAWATPSGALFSHQEQLLDHPGDMFFEHAAAMAEATFVWPNKIFFQQ